jgi:hypothetical protein
LVKAKGGSLDSEKAVSMGLAWIIEQQEKDGGWNLGGNLEGARSAATGLALLSLLGAGQTPTQGNYQEQVTSGVKFLRGRGKLSENGKEMIEPGGSMYGQGIATWALCEAYALTGDKETKEAAERAVKYLIFAQDPAGGGWRYVARQPGDMSVTGWQLSALHSARLAGLDVPAETFDGAKKFLDKLETEKGDGYGYTTASVGRATTAEGLLGRVYLGAKSDDPKLQPAFDTLAKLAHANNAAPFTNNSYFMFFGTQAMFYRGGDTWKTWSDEVRDFLVKSQSTAEGKDRGSWFNESDQFGANVGRLYQTTLAMLTLEVYYRYPANDK